MITIYLLIYVNTSVVMLCYIMLYYSKVLKNQIFFYCGLGGQKSKISPRAPTDPGPALVCMCVLKKMCAHLFACACNVSEINYTILRITNPNALRTSIALMQLWEKFGTASK